MCSGLLFLINMTTPDNFIWSQQRQRIIIDCMLTRHVHNNNIKRTQKPNNLWHVMDHPVGQPLHPPANQQEPSQALKKINATYPT